MKVLVVEDSIPVMKLMMRMLSRLGETAEGAGSVAEAIQKFDEDNFDLVVTDFHLPAQNGGKVYDYVTPSCPCIVMTGNPAAPDVGEFVGRTGAQILCKPLAIEDLQKAIEYESAPRASPQT